MSVPLCGKRQRERGLGGGGRMSATRQAWHKIPSLVLGAVLSLRTKQTLRQELLFAASKVPVFDAVSLNVTEQTHNVTIRNKVWFCFCVY